MTSSGIWRSVIIESAYEDNKALIFDLVHKVAAQFDVSYVDLLSHAHILFVKACDSYQKSKHASLKSWVHQKVFFGLLSLMRKERHYRGQVEYQERYHAPTVASQSIVSDLRTELSETANEIIDLLLDSPDDFLVLCRWNKANTRHTILRTVREHLEDAGWEVHRIKAGIHEIEEALEVDRSVPEPTPPLLARVNTTRKEIWLLARIGLSPTEVRNLLSLSDA